MNKKETIVAIMQPTFLPWIGYFGMIERVDHFVFLDSVAFDHRSWQQRNRIKTEKGAAWLSVPVQVKGLQGQSIQDVRIQYEGGDPFEKMQKTIHHAYTKCAHYKEYAAALFDIFKKKHERICDLNIDIITHFCSLFGTRPNFTRSSEIGAQGAKADLLADICERLGASAYLSPPGSKEYLDESDAFKEKGIKIFYHAYNHPSYTQLHGDFIPYMCAADLLFNEGPNSASIIKNGNPA